MSAQIFDGRKYAREIEIELAKKVGRMKVAPRIASLVFEEDKASLLYTKLKKQAAVRVGIEFSEEVVSIKDDLGLLMDKVSAMSGRGDVHGVMVQKPAKDVWVKNIVGRVNLDDWWRRLVGQIDLEKDVDCLNPRSLANVYNGDWQILPATVKAVVEILKVAMPERIDAQSITDLSLLGMRAAVLGRSDIVGKPLAAVLSQSGADVAVLGRGSSMEAAKKADIVVSAVGQKAMLGGADVNEGAVVIDVGSPDGDCVFDELVEKVRFITPVPGGVGPVTVISLLSNLVSLKSLR